jgi:hypothetical protein
MQTLVYPTNQFLIENTKMAVFLNNPTALVYKELPSTIGETDDLALEQTVTELFNLTEPQNRLNGKYVEVSSVGQVRLPTGELVAIPAATPNSAGNFHYGHCQGGVSSLRNERHSGVHWQTIIEASRFGQVNAYYHANRLATYVNGLLAELGQPSLPKAHFLVGAHDGYDPVSGEFRQEQILSGGHYRVSAKKYDPPEATDITETGEIHLGPGRYNLKWGVKPEGAKSRTRYPGGHKYFNQPSHNPAIIYHEYTHHIVRHTADFRCNDQRQGDRQSNVKSWLDEGTCDYFTAIMLGHSQIYAWQRGNLAPEHPLYRNVEPLRTLETFDNSPNADPHYNGTIWASFLWQLRRELTEQEGLTPREVDKGILQTLLMVGQSGLANPERKRETRNINIHWRNTFEFIVYCLSQLFSKVK